jgi:hypothetical protein
VSLARGLRRLVKNTILASQRPAADARWHVAPEELRGVEIRWPTTLQWPTGWTWVEPLFYGFKARANLVRCDIPQRLKGATIIEVLRGGRRHRVALNCSDYPDVVHLARGDGGGEGLELEFKMQYLKGGYGTDQILPGGFISGVMLDDWFARQPRRLRDRQRFSCDVYGRFGLGFATEIRTAALTALSNQSRFNFYGGGRKVGFRKFLQEVARARVCIDLPGNGPFCFRLVNYLAVGACIVSPPQAAVMPEPLIDRKHIVYTRPDMSDLVELCERYVNDAAAREAVVHEARVYYRRHLYWRSLADYYLRMMLDRLPA